MTRKITSLFIPVLSIAALLACAPVIASAQGSSSSVQQRAGVTQVNRRGDTRGVGRSGSGQPRAPIVVRARAGETLAALSGRFNVSVEDLAHANNIGADARLQPGQQILVPLGASPSSQQPSAIVTTPTVQANDENRLRLVDGTVIEFDDAWEDARGLWYRKRGVVNLIERSRVASIEKKSGTVEAGGEKIAVGESKAKIVEVSEREQKQTEPVWIYLVGGARVEADEVNETEAGAWYRRGGLSIFLERARIERIERERPVVSNDTAVAEGSWTERGWTTGNQNLDGLIRASGKRYGVDPYLIFCVMEQESRFNAGVVSPKGARGLMQLMPGTAQRFGVRNSFDPQQNIMGGTLYLKQLLEQFNGRVDLVLASYNAGEGAVMKYGGNVPPYRETRDYVRRIGARYGQSNSLVQATAMTRASARPAQK